MMFLIILLAIGISFVTCNTGQSIINVNSGFLIDPQCPQLKNLCSNLNEDSEDILVIECVYNFQTSPYNLLSDECQHKIYTRIKDLIDDKNVYKLIENPCSKDIDNGLSKCQSIIEKSSNSDRFSYLTCILDNKELIRDPKCRGQVSRLQSVAFNDFYLVRNFLHDCSDDIEKYECGRLTRLNEKLSQGETISCLQLHIDTVSGKCKKGILHVSEMQSDNIKFDRQLFLSCKVDVLKFCPDLQPGNGKIYKCLMKNMNAPQMTKECQSQLNRRDKLIAQDYKVSRGLAKACREDIKVNHCRRGVSDDRNIRLAQILLCLEAAHKNSSKILPDCLAEIYDHRKLLMENFQLSPEILADCSDDIKIFCQDTEDSKTIHCLMEYSRPHKKQMQRVSAHCQRAIEQLVKVSDIGEDWRVDPVLHNSCQSVVDVACAGESVGNSRIMSCLMDKLGTNYMTKKCEAALMQIQYFTARDFKLDAMLYDNCKEDAVKFCHAKNSWADVDGNQMDPERGPLVLPCLHRYAFSDENALQLSENCYQEVKRVMRQRAVSVDLIPEVEDVCLEDLANYCLDKTQRGEEMECLQQHLEYLSSNCMKAVTGYTEEEAEHIELNPLVTAACGDALKKYCGDIMSGREEGNPMDCLISIKNDILKPNIKCRAAIEHFQIISVKNYVFTYKFKQACKIYVTRYCPSKKIKPEVVACLSEIMANDTIHGQKHSLPKQCREQVRSQLYQQHENIDLDPKLKNLCIKDIKLFCSNVPKNDGHMLECLQTHNRKISPECKEALFSVKLTEMTDSRTDFSLMNSCKGMINQYCSSIEHPKVLKCLSMHKDEPLFEKKCHIVVLTRMIEQKIDYRFNPDLQQACSKNIVEHCHKIIAAHKKSNEELNGKVIRCLKEKFREGKLIPKCEKQMSEILHDEALNYKLNPLLASVCRYEIEILCSAELEKNDEIEDGSEENQIDNANHVDEDENGSVSECLKKQFLAKKIITQECKVELATIILESKADIHVDPILLKSCTTSLLKYCSNIEPGNGRQLKCLQIILSDDTKSKALEADCKNKLEQRMDMFKNAALIMPQPENLQDLYVTIVASPSRRYFAILLISFIGIIFVLGLMFGRVSKKSVAHKVK